MIYDKIRKDKHCEGVKWSLKPAVINRESSTLRTHHTYDVSNIIIYYYIIISIIIFLRLTISLHITELQFCALIAQ